VEHVESWPGQEQTIFNTVERAFFLCDEKQYGMLKYDSDGLGAGVRGDAEVINARRDLKLDTDPYRGSSGVYDPTGEDQPGRKNEDFFANRKAQSWWSLRKRFYQTYRAVVEGAKIAPDEMISLSSTMPALQQLIVEISQPVMRWNTAGKLLIDKAPDSTKSPNLADSLVIALAQDDSLSVWARL
jgi:phage terminase large subunit